MKHLSARLHAFVYRLFKPHPRTIALRAYKEVEAVLSANGLNSKTDRYSLAAKLMDEVISLFDLSAATEFKETALRYAQAAFAFEGLFELPPFDWDKRHSIAEYWELQDNLKRQRVFVLDLEETKSQIREAFWRTVTSVHSALPAFPQRTESQRSIIVPTELIHAINGGVKVYH